MVFLAIRRRRFVARTIRRPVQLCARLHPRALPVPPSLDMGDRLSKGIAIKSFY
jgi:hypothetical protein